MKKIGVAIVMALAMTFGIPTISGAAIKNHYRTPPSCRVALKTANKVIALAGQGYGDIAAWANGNETDVQLNNQLGIITKKISAMRGTYRRSETNCLSNRAGGEG